MLSLTTASPAHLEAKARGTGSAGVGRALLEGFLEPDRRGPARHLLALNSWLPTADALAGHLIGRTTEWHEILWIQVGAAASDGDGMVEIGEGADTRLKRGEDIPSIVTPLLHNDEALPMQVEAATLRQLMGRACLRAGDPLGKQDGPPPRSSESPARLSTANWPCLPSTTDDAGWKTPMKLFGGPPISPPPSRCCGDTHGQLEE